MARAAAARFPGCWLNSPQALALTLSICDQIFLLIFTFELTVKAVAYGFLVGNAAFVAHADCGG